VNEALASARLVTEGLLVVTRAAEAVMPATGGSLTVMLQGPHQASSSLAEGLADERTLFCDVMVDEETIARMADLNDGKRDIRDRD
ncbi:MAG: hypothetical protein CMM03_08500, partial [Rhodopirellula sp.]|nr:hypothetical protein [Rhodopirellula sp.]